MDLIASRSAIEIVSDRFFEIIKEISDQEINDKEIKIITFTHTFIRKLGLSYEQIPSFSLDFVIPYLLCLKGLLLSLSQIKETDIFRGAYYPIIDFYRTVGNSNDITKGMVKGFLNEVISKQDIPQFVRDSLVDIIVEK
jgi:hypothetical protein